MLTRRHLSMLVAAIPLAAAAPAPAHAGPSDGQIAHIAFTAGAIDAEVGKLALAKSANAAVRAFAEAMVRDHEAVNERALNLLKRLGMTPEDNPTSAALLTAAADTLARLRSLEGTAFDQAYVANEIEFHRTVNAALKETLIPSAHNAELKELLSLGLSLFGEHQKHAEHLAASLA